MADAVYADEDQVISKLNELFDAWEASDEAFPWNGAASFVSGTGKADEYTTKSAALQSWLLSYELTDTLMLFTRKPAKELHVITRGKSKMALLNSVKDAAQTRAGVRVVVHQKDKQSNGEEQVSHVLESARSAGEKLGVLEDDAKGTLIDTFMQKVRNEEYELSLVNISAALGDLLDIGDPTAVGFHKRAAALASSVLVHVVDNRLVDAIESEKKVPHSRLAEEFGEYIKQPSRLKLKGFNDDDCDLPHEPVVQSNGRFNLSHLAGSDKNLLDVNRGSTVVLSLGSKFSGYCGSVTRTLLVHPTDEQKHAYESLLQAQQAAIASCVQSANVADPYNAAKQNLSSELVGYLTTHVGHPLSMQFADFTHSLSPDGYGTLKEGMVLNVAVGLTGLESNGKAYALWIGDTVEIKGEGEGQTVHTLAPEKSFESSAFYFEEEAEEEEEEHVEGKENDVKVEPENDAAAGKRQTRGTTGSKDDQEQQKQQPKLQKMTENELYTKQKELAERKSRETYERLTKKNENQSETMAGLGQQREHKAYDSPQNVPGAKGLPKEILVDRKSEAVLLPIFGCMVPFHVTSIKSVNVSSEGSNTYLRLNFHHPSVSKNAQTNPYKPASWFPELTFVKEASFRSTDEAHANRVVQDVRQLKRQVSQRETEKQERASLVKQEKLKLNKQKPPKLQDVWVRPHFGGRKKKQPGVLEAHVNGFRFQTGRQDETVDVIYRNIKHAFFQPSQGKELITVVHFHLFDDIMMGKKKTRDIQFYAEVIDASQDLGQARKAMYDPDELEDEQREREKRNKINVEFQQFVKKVQDLWERDFPELNLEFDLAYRELGFPGVPHKESTTIFPTLHCMVDLIQFPFTVITLDDIEVIALERAGASGIKNFDMRVVFKDFDREPHLISSIPMNSLDTIKEWLTSIQIKFYETKVNLVWKSILQSIKEDPDMFYSEGGWEFLNLEDDDDGDDDDDDEEDAFDPEEEDAGDESEYEGSEDEVQSGEEEAGEEEGEEALDEEEEQGMDWDEMEKKAAMEDEEKALEDDDTSKGKKRKADTPAKPSKMAKR